MISIFVSSTFGDMQAERDIIRQRVLPRLQKFAAEYGESVRIIDLRWGVNTTSLSKKEATERIIDDCFEQIDKCNGRMFCLLGNRYGSAPEEYTIEEICERYGLQLSEEVSLTELEIQYGILQREISQESVVFVRNEIKDLPHALYDNYNDNDERLERLKIQLNNSEKCLCKNYSLTYTEDGEFDGLDDFEELAFVELSKYIVREIGDDNEEEYKRLRNCFAARIDEEVQDYWEILEIKDEFSEFIESNTSFLVLKAEAGMGKTAFSSYICNKYKNKMNLFYFFCGYNAACETPLQLTEYLIRQIGDYLHIETEVSHVDLMKNSQILSYLFKQLEPDTLFVIDGIDHITSLHDQRLIWIPEEVPDNIKFFITTSNDDKSYESLGRYSTLKVLNMPMLNNPEVFIKHLLDTNGKNISDDVLNEALCDHNLENYYYAKMIADALIMMDRYDFQEIKHSGDGINAINKFISNALKEFPKNIEGMALFLLHDYGKRIAPQMIPQVYTYIACNQGGLRATDLEKVLGSKWDDISFERYISFLSGMIIERENGCYDFASQIVRNAVEKLIKWDDKKKIIRHIETLENDDPIKISYCLPRALLYEHYDVVYSLIKDNPESQDIINQFVGCLNHMENEIIGLLKKCELYEWFFNNVLPLASSVQERNACLNIVLNVLNNVPDKMRRVSLEFLGDNYMSKNEYSKAEMIYSEYLDSVEYNLYADRGRVNYKLASSLIVNSDDDYNKLNATLRESIKCFETKIDDLNTSDKMTYVLAKYNLIMLEWDYNYHGIYRIQAFDFKTMTIKDGVDSPHLKFISGRTVEFLKDEAVESIDETIKRFNECLREANEIYALSLLDGTFEKVIQQFIEIQHVYDFLNLAVGRADRLRQIKIEIEKRLRKQFSLVLYQLLGQIEYDLAKLEPDDKGKEMYYTRCCSIWGQFVKQRHLPNFAGSYIKAEMELAKMYLIHGDDEKADEHLSKWSQAEYNQIIGNLRTVFKTCQRYPDEIHYMLLEDIRDNVADVQRTKVKIKYIKDDYTKYKHIEMQVYYDLIKTRVFMLENDMSMKKEFVSKNFNWLKEIYIKMKNCEVEKSEQNELDFIRTSILKLMLSMLDMVSSVVTEKNAAEKFYKEKIFAIEELHRYDMQRLEKIWFGHMYAKTLIEQAKYNYFLVETNYTFAIEVLTAIRLLLYEKETTPLSIIHPMIDLKKINSEICMAKMVLASYYKETGRNLMAVETYESTIELALSLVGVNEDSQHNDLLYVKTALMSCVQTMEIYAMLDMVNEANAIKAKYEKIRTLVE